MYFHKDPYLLYAVSKGSEQTGQIYSQKSGLTCFVCICMKLLFCVFIAVANMRTDAKTEIIIGKMI